MKILQINSTANSGSTGRIAEDLGKAVISEGGSSIIAFGRESYNSQSKTIKIGSKIDQVFHLLFTRLFDSHGFHSSYATKKLIKEIKKVNPEIIHLHNLHGYYLNIELLFSFLKTYNKPVIWTLHDCWSYTGHCCYYERVSCEKWKTECNKCPLQFLYPESKWIDNSRRNYIKKKAIFNGVKDLTIVTVSKWLQSEVKKSYLNTYPSLAIYNGIDSTIFRPSNQYDLKRKFGYIDKKIILGVANEWSEGKGLNKFIEISKEISEGTIIILVGLNSNQINTLPDNIIGVKRTKDIYELAEYYSMADVFVTPSIAETFGLVVAEALSCGTPCVVNNSSALPELVDESVGFVVSNTVSEYVNAINKIICDPKEKYVDATFEKSKQFTLDLHLKNHLDLYKQKLDL